jgi:hypothetical protein
MEEEQNTQIKDQNVDSMSSVLNRQILARKETPPDVKIIA